MKLKKHLLLGRKAMEKLDSVLKSRDTLPTKAHLVKAMVFAVVQMWELNHKESWGPKNWCFRTVVLEKTLESPLDCKELKPVSSKGNWPWILIGRTDVEAETPMLWPPDAKNWLIGKDPNAGKDWRQEEKETTEDEMIGWHHRLNGHEFEQVPQTGDGQQAPCAAVHGVAKSQIWMIDWTELNWGCHWLTDCWKFISHVGQNLFPCNFYFLIPARLFPFGV